MSPTNLDDLVELPRLASERLLQLSERRPQIPLDRLLLVYDDFSLPLGALRLRPRGGPGGQKGMASVIELLSTDEIARLRLGILPEGGLPADAELYDFVLSPFDEPERDPASAQVELAADACESWLREGSEATMNRFNSVAADRAEPEPNGGDP